MADIPAEIFPTVHHARVEWQGSREDMRAHTVELSDQQVLSSCAAEWGGDPAKADPEEMFVGALAGCHMLWFVNYARERRLRIATYVDHPSGVLDGEKITSVTLRPQATFDGDQPSAELLAELHHLAHERCFLAATVNCPISIEPTEA